MHETTLGHDRILTAYVLQPHPANDTTKLLLTATLDVSGRTSGEKVLWSALGGHSYNTTRKMLTHDLEDIRKEAESRAGGVAGRHRAS
jgi:hypothetical protein